MNAATVNGYITDYKFIRGIKSLRELENRLGFKEKSFEGGVKIFKLIFYPKPNQFEFDGYTYMDPNINKKRMAEIKDDFGKNLDARKNWVIDNVWYKEGVTLVKVVRIKHESKVEFVKGSGIPQWVLTADLEAVQIDEIRE